MKYASVPTTDQGAAGTTRFVWRDDIHERTVRAERADRYERADEGVSDGPKIEATFSDPKRCTDSRRLRSIRLRC